MVNDWISPIGSPADEALFREVEAHVQGFSAWLYLQAPLAVLRFARVPPNLPLPLLEQHERGALSHPGRH
ncbi:hypothetical protein [Inhella proteolytica]|uniref:Uncharacterized protein n=1 Tax=Inhella proteolytica TaxID=2795029 RepID=A0A931J2B5_9BURK|nr:hypothetical protein [Inhella proteolytica]MBH9576254.1 hypothetical protein [Inhella proteolytica]